MKNASSAKSKKYFLNTAKQNLWTEISQMQAKGLQYLGDLPRRVDQALPQQT